MNSEIPELSFAFQYPWVLLFLLLIPLAGILRGRFGPHAALEFSSLHILKRLGKRVKTRFGGFSAPVLLWLVLASGLIALARPQQLKSYRIIRESGIEMILAIDVSRSMLAEDMHLKRNSVNRLTAARSVMRDFIRLRPMDRLGLVAFAGRPYLVSPITLDHDWVLDSLDRVEVGAVEDGTAIGSAIAAAARRLDQREARSKVIVLLTDGANNAGKLHPVKAAELAATLGIRIYTIAVGTPGEHYIPTPNGPMLLRQEFDEDTLQQIAELSDGKFFQARDTSTLEKIFADIDTLETTERKARIRIDPTDFFQWFVGLAILFLVIRFVMSETVMRRYP